MGVLIGIKHDQLKGLYQYINVPKKERRNGCVLAFGRSDGRVGVECEAYAEAKDRFRPLAFAEQCQAFTMECQNGKDKTFWGCAV